jgi:alpha-beta hydrolase superfamily lysophospholipase
MNRIEHVIYLHGFASSPAGSKATRFGYELRQRGIPYDCPDLNEPAFETLTVTRMLDQTKAAIASAKGPVALVGSSLGGFVAAHAADQDRTGKIDRLVLLAPALDFGGNRLRQLGEHGIDEWRRSGRLSVFHYADNTHRDVGFGLYEDAAAYDAFAVTLTQPVLAFQGERDASVDPRMVERWAVDRPNVDLRLLDDDHHLTSSVDLIWKESAAFFGL